MLERNFQIPKICFQRIENAVENTSLWFADKIAVIRGEIAPKTLYNLLENKRRGGVNGMPAEPAEEADFLFRVGERVHNRRKARGLSQERLAEQARVSAITIHRIEKGEKSSGILSYYLVAQALGLSLVELLSGEQDDQEQALLTNWRKLKKSDRAVAFVTYMALSEALQRKGTPP